MTKEESGKCSYEGCGREIFWPQGYTPQPEERPRCIFHSPLIEQKKEAFRSAWKEFLDQHKNKKGEYQNFTCKGFIFPENVNFMAAIFCGWTSFEGATFSKFAWFEFATFRGEAGFLGHSALSGRALFDGTTFSGEARFGYAIFSGDATFLRTTFSERARFEGATFSKVAWFVGATFIREASFWGTDFQGDVSFNQARWKGGANFSRARLKEASLDFIGVNYEDENKQEHDTRLFEGDKKIWFDHINFREAKRVRFEHVDLSRASFKRSSIENVDFIDVWWEEEGKGHKIYDERKWRERRVQGETEVKGEVNQSEAEPKPPATASGRDPNLPLSPALSPKGRGIHVWRFILSPSGRGIHGWRFTLSPWGRGEGEGCVGRDWIRARIEAVREEFRLLRRKDKDELKEIENLYHQLILN